MNLSTNKAFLVPFFICLVCKFALAQEEPLPLTYIDPVNGIASAELTDVEIANSLREVDSMLASSNFAASFKSFSNFLKRIQEAKKDKSIYLSLEISPDQESKIAELASNFENAMRKLDALELSREERKKQELRLEKVFLTRLSGLFEEFQIKEFHNWNILVGLPKMLVRSGYGESIGLTPIQKKRIEDKSQKLLEDFSLAIREFRQHSAELVFEELTRDQRKKLSKKLDMKRLNDLAERASVRQILKMHNFEDSKLDFDKFLNSRDTREYSLRVWPEDEN